MKAQFASEFQKNSALRADFTSNVGIFRPLVKVAPEPPSVLSSAYGKPNKTTK